MKSKVQKKSTSKTAVDNVHVDIANDEKDSFNLFFNFLGMKKAFLEKHTAHKRRHLDHALESGSFKIGMLKDVRLFVEEHKDEISEFIKSDAA